jgi:hypothetical protein
LTFMADTAPDSREVDWLPDVSLRAACWRCKKWEAEQAYKRKRDRETRELKPSPSQLRFPDVSRSHQ